MRKVREVREVHEVREVEEVREVCAPLSSPPGARVHVLCAAILCAPRLGRLGA